MKGDVCQNTLFELLLIDDGSKDRCPQICDEYAKQDNRIQVLHKENGGLVSARNAGIHMATGEYICYIDSDDWVTDNWFSEIDKASKQNPNMIM